MVRQSIKGDFDLYSWWHRQLNPLDIREVCTMMDIDDMETLKPYQPTLDVFVEYNKNTRQPVALVETINVEQDVVSQTSESDIIAELTELPERRPLNDHKSQVLTNVARDVPYPVFVVWIDWLVANRNDDNTVSYAKPRGFLVRELPSGDDRAMDEQAYISFLAELHGLKQNRGGSADGGGA